jgi:hypothetical protein
VRAIMIDPEQHSVQEIEIEPGLENLHKALDCTYVELFRGAFGNDDLWIDEESVLHDPIYFFSAPHFPQPIAGKALILAYDDEGECRSTMQAVEEVRASLEFMELIAADV